MTEKEKCLDDLKAYYGIKPYKEHISYKSRIFYNWTVQKYGLDLVIECEDELDEGK